MSRLKLGRLFGGVAVAAALATGLAGCGKEADMGSMAGEGAARIDLIAELVKGADREGSMAAIRQKFPDDYARFGTGVRELAGEGASREQQMAAFDQVYDAFLGSKGSNATLASDEHLTAWVRTRLDVAKALQAQDVTLCGYYFTMGRWGSTPGSPEVLKAAQTAGVAFVDAIADGEAHPVERSATSGTDARALGGAFVEAGTPPETLDLVKSVARQGNASLKTLPADKVCAFGIAYYEALLALDPGIRGRIVSRMTMTGRYFSS